MLDMEELTLQISNPQGMARIGLKLNSFRFQNLPDRDAETVILKSWEDDFQTWIAPIIESITSAAKRKPDLIWNQFGAHILSMRHFIARMETRENVIAKLDQGIALLRQLPGAVFNRKRNPFQHQPRLIDSPYEPGATMIIRSSCCMYDKRENGRRCYNCRC
ncbi:hypothetical protein [Paenibacillus sp. 1001270B_150601_E10]|uniref:hypothetical protein n=1 Tax=Paenibacillus sp. 1001270B_150601_E10 TaxID=2787079 RepID=UPI001E49C2EB|nr:hypothetical protein [Paenibacillus sp. 1001270B_150601_E10]